PLQLALFALILRGLLKAKAMRVWHAIGIGALAGLTVLNRFDALPLPFLVTGMIWWLTRRPGHALAAVAAAAVTLSPWIAYSLSTFGSVFATDNAGIATSLDPRAFVTDWWPAAQPSLADDPLAWLAKVVSALPRLAWVAASVLASPLGLAFATAFLGLGAFVYLAAKGASGPEATGMSKQPVQVAIAFAAITALMLAPQVLTGYVEYRYLTALAWSGALALGVWLIASGRTAMQREVYARLAALGLALWIAPITALSIDQVAQPQAARWQSFEAPAQLATLTQCLSATPQARVLVLGDNLFAAKAGALGGHTTMMEPRNMVEGRLDTSASRAFLKAKKVDFVLVMDPVRENLASETLGLTRRSDCELSLYRR
ncbi:MAG: hypothetical protein HRT64_06390, partial [Erythrobacter sp.]|nr:hypothetical protein [Erythrobacter sp.]